jgi:hypothetical protein
VIRVCNGTDRNLISEDGATPCDCGLAFDDVDRLVIWPHTPFGPKMSADELEAILRMLPEGARMQS